MAPVPRDLGGLRHGRGHDEVNSVVVTSAAVSFKITLLRPCIQVSATKGGRHAIPITPQWGVSRLPRAQKTRRKRPTTLAPCLKCTRCHLLRTKVKSLLQGVLQSQRGELKCVRASMYVHRHAFGVGITAHSVPKMSITPVHPCDVFLKSDAPLQFFPTPSRSRPMLA